MALARRGLRASLALMACAAIVLAGLELFCRFGIPRISRIEGQVATEYRAACAFKGRPSSPTHLLVLGNSLLERGVHFTAMQRTLAPDIDARRFVVSNTSYYDWYFGLRRLFARGSRPNTVVLVLNPRQLVMTSIRGEYFAYHLMQGVDVVAVARALRLSNTEASNLAFASHSALFGLGAEFRKVLAGRLIPGLPRLTVLMTKFDRPPLQRSKVIEESVTRLRALREVAGRYGTRVVLVVPPTHDGIGAAGYSAVQEAGTVAGVTVLVPVAPETLGPEHFSPDNFHLSDRGAELFTARLVKALREQDLAGNLRPEPAGEAIVSAHPPQRQE